MSIISKKIDKIAFGVISTSMIRKMSAIQVITPEIYDADGYPVERGLMDSAMGVIDPGMRCKTCGGRIKNCNGHFGHIVLSKPVIHILFAERVYAALRSSCKECGRIVANPTRIKEWEAKLKRAKKEHDLETIRKIISEVVRSASTVKKCPYCKTPRAKIKLVKPTAFQEDDQRIWPTEVRERLERIPDEDLKILGYDPFVARPEWMVLTLLAVPPIPVRPSITLESGDRSEDDLTHKLTDIVRVNQRLLENINAGAPEVIVEDLWDLLQYHVTTFFHNNIAQIPPARHRTQRQLKTVYQRLTSKEGRFRFNLAGKRVNFSARSVISPDPYIDINELGVPIEMAKELTIPERVTDWNMKWLKGLIKDHASYPGANYVISPEGRRKKITEETVEQILEDLEPGWRVERNLIDGDIVIFNRQPSLHRISMLGHRVRVVPGKTLRINPIICTPYNADFDGDEMNMHAPQTEEARAEAESLLLLQKNIITPRYGLSIIGPTFEVLLGLHYLTKLDSFGRQEASELLLEADIDSSLPKAAGKINGKEYWTGRQIFSMLLPKDMNFEAKGKVLSKDGRLIKGTLKITNGELVSGIIDKTFVGPEGGLLIHHLQRVYDTDRASLFINQANRLGLAVGRRIAQTFSFYDLDISDSEKTTTKNVLDGAYKEVQKLTAQYRAGKIIPLPGKTTKETFEAKILAILSRARNSLGDAIEKNIKTDSTLVNSAQAGAGDKVLSIVIMSGFFGQQELQGERINLGYSGRTLSHFKKGDLSPRAHGFIESNLVNGMDPVELFFNSVVGRDSLMDTAMRTPKSGYMQRRLINALQDLKVDYDGTVRDSGRQIVQFRFGGDNLDISKSEGGNIIND